MKSELSVPNVGSLMSLPANTTHNALHEFYNQLLANCDYPLLARILFLQLVTRENVLLYSSRRAEVKEAWIGLAKQLKDNQSSVFAIDPETKIDEVLASKGERRVLLFDLGKIGTQGVNFLLNNSLSGITLLAVEDESHPLRPQLSDIFPLVFRDEESAEQEHSTVPPSSTAFDKQKFQACIAANFNLSQETKDEDSFFKSYLALLKERAHQYGVQLPHSRWKKMALILKLIGTSRTPGVFKHLAPTDCLMAPECLGRTPQQLQNLSKANQQTLLDLIPNYGTHHWIKQLTHHFWISPERKNYYLSLAEKLSNRVSFFYPCGKYPEVMKLLVDQKSFHYRVTGHDKKLLSDKYLEINPQKGYRLSFQFRCQDSILLHAGIACYDKDKKPISPVQVCRIEDSVVRVKAVEGNHLVVVEEDVGNLTKWKQSGAFAYQKCLGFYGNGDTTVLLSQNQILLPDVQPYSTEDSRGIFSGTTEKSIVLTEMGLKRFKKCEQSLIPGVSKVMNHYQGGTYCLGGSFKGAEPVWKEVKMDFRGASRQNNGTSFLVGTKWVRVVLLVNYNSGFPDFAVEKKQAMVDFRTIEWHSI